MRDITKGSRTSQVCRCKMGYYSSGYSDYSSHNHCIKYNNQGNGVLQKGSWSFLENIKILLLFGVPLGFAITYKLISYRNKHPERFGRSLPQTSVIFGQTPNSPVPTAPVDHSNLPFATFPLTNSVYPSPSFEVPIEPINYSDLPFATHQPLLIDIPSAPPPDDSRPPPYPNELPTYEEALSVGNVRIL